MPRARIRKSRRLAQAVCAEIWAITEGKLAQIVELLDLRAEGLGFTPEEIRQRIAPPRLHGPGHFLELDGLDEEEPEYHVVDGVAILPMQGVLAPRMNWMIHYSGGTSTQQLASWFREAMNRDDVQAILFDCDSPGGSAAGNEELANLIRAARGTKPIKTVVTGQCCSAAYYTGSAADEVIASPSSEIGSIGTLWVHQESSKAHAAQGTKYSIVKAGAFKAIGNSYEPLSAEARSVMQEKVDDWNELFVNAVAANRGVKPSVVEKDFGQGKTFLAAKAMAAGLVDRVGTLQEVFDELRATKPGRKEAQAVDKNVKQALVARGLIAADASDAMAQAALNAYFAGVGQAVPKDPGSIVAALKKKPARQEEDDVDEEEDDEDDEPVDEEDDEDPPVDEEEEDDDEETQRVPTSPRGPRSPRGRGRQQRRGRGERMTAQERRRIQTAERARIQDLEARGRLLGIDQADIDRAVEQGLPVERALERWTRTQSERLPAVGKREIRAGESGDDKLMQGAVEALGRRAGLRQFAEKPVSANARDLQHKSLMRVAEACLRATGQRVLGDDDDIAAAALRGSGAPVVMGPAAGYNTPADFPNILSALAGKIMDEAMEFAPSTYREWAAPIASVPDFKPKTIVAAGEFGELPRVPDGDDFEDSTVAEEASWIAVDSYGDEFSVTPRMIVDDDLGMFTEKANDKVVAHEMTLNRLCVNLLTGNVLAGDGVALFDSAHGNELATGLAPSTAQLAAIRLKLRKQTGVSGKRKLSLPLSLLLIPEDLETTTEQLLIPGLQVVPTAETAAQIFRGRVKYAVEPMLGEDSAVKYYGFADPRLARAIVYTFQRGFEQMKRRMYYNPKNNSQVVQVEGRMAAAVRNWRGVVRNAGTGG